MSESRHSSAGSSLSSYPVPARTVRREIRIVNSRFIATVGLATSVEDARALIAQIRDEFPDATHHVPAYLLGHGASVIAHCSDDGEPSGTAGRPVLAVLRGSGLGDVVIVVTRYFGGTKLGTGGLVRAYSDAAREVLAALPRAIRVPTHVVTMTVPYALFERARQLVQEHSGEILDESFAAEVTISARLSVAHFAKFSDAMRELSRGSVFVEIQETDEATIMPLSGGATDWH
jgi:uncharacterized YigZ family protein